METRRAELATGAVVGAVGAFFARDLHLAALLSYAGASTPGIVLGALFGALLWVTPLRRAVAILVGLLGLAFLAVAFPPLSAWAYEGLARRDPLVPADAVFVSSSRLQEDGEMTNAALNRLVHGLEIIGSGNAPRLILAELRPPQGSYA